MSDRVPICTIPGLVSAILNTDVMVAPADVAKLITRVFLQRTDNGSGDVVTAAIHNATAGGGDKIEVTLADGESEAMASGSITVEASEPAYLRVSATDSNSQNIRGWFEVDGAAGTTSLLTNLALVEQFLDSDTGDDDLIGNLVAAVSNEIQGWLDRQIIQATATDERLDSIGDIKLHTHYFPIISISSLTENGTALVEGTDFESQEWDKLSGGLVRISGGYPTGWASGSRRITATYTYGYADIPWAIQMAATKLVAFDYLQSGASAQARFGLAGKALDTGGTAAYTTRQGLWDSLKPSLSPYRRAWM